MPERSSLTDFALHRRAHRLRWATAAVSALAAMLTSSPTHANDVVSSNRMVSANSFQQGFGHNAQSFESSRPGEWSSGASAGISGANQTSNVQEGGVTASTSTSASGNGFSYSSASTTLSATIVIDVASVVTFAGSGYVNGNAFNFSAEGSASIGLSGPGGLLFDWSKYATGAFGSPNWSGTFDGVVEVPAGTYLLTFNSSSSAGSGGAGSSSNASTSITFDVDIAPLPPPGLYVPSEYPTIAAALAAANDGETIYIAPGVYHERGLVLSKSVSILPSAGAGEVIIDGGGLSPGILFITGSQGPETLLKGITLRNSGGGTPIPFAPQFDAGGAILINGGSPRIESCVFASNHAGFGAAIYTISSAAEFVDCTFEDNVAANDGGALQALNSPVTITGCAFRSNTAQGIGGAVHCPFGAGPLGEVTLTDCEFRGNSAALGGAVSFDTAPPLRTLVLTGSIIECNTAVSGGAIYSTANYPDIVEASDTKICSNSDPQFIGSPLVDGGGNTVCGCRGDLDASGIVGAADLSLLLGDWGGIESDLDCDGVVGSADLAIVLGSWGPC